MSNLDQAAHLIMEAARQSELPTETAVNAVEALAKAGLLAPDLPEEDVVSANGTPVWRPAGGLMVTAFRDGEVRMGIPPTYPDTEFREAIYTRQSATRQALALLSAAQYTGDRDE